MRNAILKFVESHHHASIHELCLSIPGFKGDKEWFAGTNTVYWSYCSEEAIDTMVSLWNDGVVIPISVSPLAYMIDGAIPRYPIAIPGIYNYDKPHWLPIAFSTPNQYKLCGMMKQ